jgi:polyisoprenyl-teichoic acid--peptidoglycan teichoic acid transferase
MRNNKNSSYRWLSLVFLIVLILPIGCSPSIALSAGNEITEQPQVAATLHPTYVLAGPDATVTPTPFQPATPTVDLTVEEGESGVGSTPTPLPTPTPLAMPTIDESPQEELAQLPSQMNILLLGSDKRKYGGGTRTDTIILVTINSELESVNITSFPRDLWVTIPGRGQDRINTAWTYGGNNLLRETFLHNFGVTVDRFVLVEFSSFKKIIDQLGGLTVDVSQPLSDYRAGVWVSIPKGDVQMDADTVLWYARSRKTSNDLARNRRQQEVLQAVFHKLMSLNAIKRAPEFYDLYREGVKTDISLLDILAWLPMVSKIADTMNIHQYYINYNHVYDWVTPGGAMVLVPNREAVMGVIRMSQNLK